MYRKILFILFPFISIIFLISLFRFETNTANFVGEKLFLKLHLNNLASKVLEFNQNKDFKSHFLLGRIYFVESRLNESIDSFTRSIEMNPNYKQSYYGRGLSYGFSSPLFLNDAEQDFKTYIELENQEFKNSGVRAYGAWAGYNDLAWVYFLKGDFENSEIYSRLGLALGYNNPWLLNMLSTSLISQDKCSKAITFLETAKVEVEKITVEEFGEAYSGDNKKWWPHGKESMKKTIEENLELCKTL